MNETLIEWFGLLNLHFGVKGDAKIVFKLHGDDITEGVTFKKALKNIKEGLVSTNKSYIYHCWDHYCCPIGFEATPRDPRFAYDEDIGEVGKEGVSLDHWLVIGDCEPCFPPFHVIKWAEIAKDIDMEFPAYMDIRRPEYGVRELTTPEHVEGHKKGGNYHCFIEFTSTNKS
jgi:hypothetical protein